LIGFARQLSHFAECAESGRAPQISLEDSDGNERAIQMLLDSAYTDRS